jgi:hypothetical protein
MIALSMVTLCFRLPISQYYRNSRGLKLWLVSCAWGGGHKELSSCSLGYSKWLGDSCSTKAYLGALPPPHARPAKDRAVYKH